MDIGKIDGPGSVGGGSLPTQDEQATRDSASTLLERAEPADAYEGVCVGKASARGPCVHMAEGLQAPSAGVSARDWSALFAHSVFGRELMFGMDQRFLSAVIGWLSHLEDRPVQRLVDALASAEIWERDP